MKIKLINTIIDPLNEGIFHAIENLQLEELSFITQADAIFLDQEYYFNHSGEKFISPLYVKLKEREESGRLIYALDTLANIITRKYADKWKRLYIAFVETTYNPVENYNGTETEKVASKIQVQTDSGSDIYAFNSGGNPTPVAESGATQTTTGNANDNVRTLEKHGNIGVTSNQDMLKQEADLRQAFNLIEEMYKDVDEVLTQSLY